MGAEDVRLKQRMDQETAPTIEERKAAYQHLKESYLDPESLDPNDLERILKEGEVRNLRPIEEFEQEVPGHADQVLLGEMAHGDIVFEAEIVLPGQEKPLLVIYKPESGVNQGTDKSKTIPIPEDSSPFFKKEIAAWVVARELGLSQLAVPVVDRTLSEGPGSVRPYIWGEPLELLDEETLDQVWQQRQTLEDVAVYDYLLQTLDRRQANMLWCPQEQGGQLKVIDHSLTFFSESFSERWHKKGPRVMMAYDTSRDPEVLKKEPLPERWLEKIGGFLERETEIRQSLAEHLTEKEINDTLERAQKLADEKIFL